MNRGALIGAAGLLAFSAWWAYRNQPAVAEQVGAQLVGTWGAVESAANEAVTILGGSMLRLSRMKEVRPAMLGNQNVRAMLAVIRAGEGTADADGYRRLVGGGEFDSFADHPRIVKSGTFSNGKSWRSSAAGAYQFIASTWDETARIMNLPDFSPASQDMGALGRIAARGALADVMAGRFDAAVQKCASEWASLPGSPYGQPVITWDRARSLFASSGGMVAA